MVYLGSRWSVWKYATAVSLLATGVVGDNVLKTSGFTTCAENADMKVDRVNISYNNGNKTVVFDVAGSSSAEQNVSATIEVKAYGISIYENSFNPCDKETAVAQLCPVPEGEFSAWGSQKIPAEYADMVPGIAFQIPDIAAQATLRLKSLDTDEDVACIQSQVTNGKTADVAAVLYVAAGIMGAALLLSGVSAIGSAVASGGTATGGSGTISPGFTEVVGWFQGLAMNGMMSVNYPPVYRSFTKNFGFSTGMIPWEPLLSRIDQFRAVTGGNLTDDSVEALKNVTLVYPDGSSNTVDQGMFKVKRALETFAILAKREFNTGFDTSGSDDNNGTEFQKTVSGIQAFANQLRVPESDVFMTILLIVAIIIAAIVVCLLLVKVILEVWAIWGNFPKGLAGFRQHYWGSIARAITSLIFVLYGIWVLYCVFQFTRGDSWAAITLAAVTLAIFTGILVFFSWKIWNTARKLKAAHGDTNALYDDKNVWVKYSLFYDSYKKQYWWLFLPLILYMAIKGCVLAAADGSGRAQTIAVLIVEAVFLALLLWSRPFERKSGNVVNIAIQVVRVLSVVCILVFVEEFGIRQTTQTVTGVVLIAVQSTLTVALVLLIAWHAIEACFQKNPHRKRRKEMEKMLNRDDMDDLTPLDARNSLLLDRPTTDGKISAFSHKSSHSLERDPMRPGSPDRYGDGGMGYQPPVAPSGGPLFRDMAPTTEHDVRAGMGQGFHSRQPSLPSVGPQYGQRYQPSYGNGGYRGL